MPRDVVEVRVEGLREFRRDLRKLEPAVDREMRDEIKDAVGVIAREGASNAPKGTRPRGPRDRAYASTIRAYASGNRFGIASTHPGAGVIHSGGTIAPRGVPITFRPRPTVSEAVDRHADQLVDDIDDGVERAAKRVGWH